MLATAPATVGYRLNEQDGSVPLIERANHPFARVLAVAMSGSLAATSLQTQNQQRFSREDEQRSRQHSQRTVELLSGSQWQMRR